MTEQRRSWGLFWNACGRCGVCARMDSIIGIGIVLFAIGTAMRMVV